MAENPEKRTLAFHGKSVTWISPGTLKDLLELKAKHLEGPLILGNTSLGLTIGAACSLARVKDIWAERVSEYPEKTQTCQAFLKHLKSLAGQQIWNMAIALSEHFLAGLASADLEPEGISESAYIPHSQKWEFVSAFRQAQCQQNALAHVNAGRRVLFKEGTDTVEDLSIAYGGVGAATVSAQNSCQQLPGRHWGELMLGEACRLLLDEVSLPGWAPGGRVAFKRTLVASFFFKFYLQVLQEQKKLVELFSVPNRRRYPEISDRFLSALEDFWSQYPRESKEDSVLYFKHPINRITCHVKRVGGGLGGKVGGPAVSGLLQLWALSRNRISYTEAEKCIYKIPNLRFQGHACLTNLPSDMAFCRFGFPQGTLVTESCITAVAAKCGLPPEKAAALVHIYTDGSILVTHGVNKLGQGIHTKMLQVASREFKIPMSYMHICETSTAMVPNTIATAASIGSDVNGRAVQLKGFISSIRGYKAFVDWEKGRGDPFSYYVYGAACSEIETDRLTGAHKIEGSFIQGMGLYTTEEVKYSPEGVLYSRGPDEYRIPTMSDVPEEFNVSLLPSSQIPLTIYSSKHLGVSGMFLGSSVFFTITDAVAQLTEKET
ncbi:hypothetical protein J1605_013065 [Eschrichtius robustus]|uniref:CO dehydrogenase flavoprotein C-terminal domain-containing protein n=1 Tax=Eschrichtius robustus TaxID=9764 RepID=A0AB34GGR6_ESCRO|nr:hypothetical protein J1605_013065 [Eschrichtius robustus]